MTRASLAELEELLGGQAAAALDGADVRRQLDGVDPGGRLLADLRAAWEDLPRDEHLADGGAWRERRYGRLAATPDGEGHRLEVMADQPFKQAAELIPLYKGEARLFAAVTAATVANQALLALVGQDLELVARVEGGRRPAVVGLHLIRVIATGGSDVAPAPEGRHRDGHAWIAMHLLARDGCTGGTSRVYRPGEAEPFLITTMSAELDTVIVDDRRVEHEVSPIRAAVPGRPGRRDILLVDIDLDQEAGL